MESNDSTECNISPRLLLLVLYYDSGGGQARLILVGLSFLDIGLAAMMTALGVLTLIQFSGVADTSAAFLAVYMIIFAALLGTYEVMYWVGIPWINKILRKNFGFLYGLKGKGLYLIFVAFLCLGLKNDSFSQLVKSLTWVTGISYLAVGVLHLFIVCIHPTISEKYRAPTAGLSATDGGTIPKHPIQYKQKENDCLRG